MKHIITALLIFCISFNLCGCGYNKQDLLDARESGYKAGYSDGQSKYKDEYTDAYSSGYEDGWRDAVRQEEDKKLDQGEEELSLASHVEWVLDDIINSLYDYGLYNDEEYCQLINELYGYVIDYQRNRR